MSLVFEWFVNIILFYKYITNIKVMQNKDKFRPFNARHRGYSNPIIRPPQRLIFPGK